MGAGEDREVLEGERQKWGRDKEGIKEGRSD